MKKSCETCKYVYGEDGMSCSNPSGSCEGPDLYNKYEPKDNPIQPKHYSNGGNDVIDYCYKNDIDFLTGNIIKYVVRAGKKDKTKELEDLQKAQEYLRRKIEYLKGGK